MIRTYVLGVLASFLILAVPVAHGAAARPEFSSWQKLSRAIEKGNLADVQALVPDKIARDERRNEPGVGSHNKTPHDIATFNVDKLLDPESNKDKPIDPVLLENQMQIAEYLKPREKLISGARPKIARSVSVRYGEGEGVGVSAAEKDKAWIELLVAIEQGLFDDNVHVLKTRSGGDWSVRGVKALVPAIIAFDERRNAPRRDPHGKMPASHGKTPYDIVDFNVKETFKRNPDVIDQVTAKQLQMLEYLEPVEKQIERLAPTPSPAPRAGISRSMSVRDVGGAGPIAAMGGGAVPGSLRRQASHWQPSGTSAGRSFAGRRARRASMSRGAGGIVGVGEVAVVGGEEESEKEFAAGHGVGHGGLSFNELVRRSDAFERKTLGHFPTEHTRIKNLGARSRAVQETIAQQASEARPIVHRDVLTLMRDFLAHKKQYGSKIEQGVYAGMNVPAFIDRLLTKRPLAFYKPVDKYVLRNGTRGEGSFVPEDGFESIGTRIQKFPMAQYLSYDEMAISALLGVATPTYFLNDGSRTNYYKPNHRPYEETGVYTALVGARFDRPERMEREHMLVEKLRSTPEDGYGPRRGDKELFPRDRLLSIWAKFYGLPYFPTYGEAVRAVRDRTGRFVPVRKHDDEKNIHIDGLLDTDVYKKRMRMVIEPFLADANERAERQHKQAYCHVVGLGTGLWAVNGPLQEQLIVDVFAEILAERRFAHIADINFSNFAPEVRSVGRTGDGGILRDGRNQIKIHFSKRNPAAQLTGDDVGKLLVAMYAWDGNAYPGNEYWNGVFDTSGDGAAATSSTITELQNPGINPAVSSENVFVTP